MTETIGPPYMGQIALAFGGVVQYCIADDDVEGQHHVGIEFPSMWRAMEFRQLVMVPQVLGLPAQARDADVEGELTVTSVAQPVTLRVTTNPDYADAVMVAYYGAKA